MMPAVEEISTERRARMTARDLTYLPLTELSRRLGAGETSSHDIVSACLDRIAAYVGHAHAFIDV
jgi:hypothetical protein